MESQSYQSKEELQIDQPETRSELPSQSNVAQDHKKLYKSTGPPGSSRPDGQSSQFVSVDKKIGAIVKAGRKEEDRGRPSVKKGKASKIGDGEGGEGGSGGGVLQGPLAQGVCLPMPDNLNQGNYRHGPTASGDGDTLEMPEACTQKFACECGKVFPRNNSLVRHKSFNCLLNANPDTDISSKRRQTPSPLKTPKSAGLKLFRPSPITPAKASLECSVTTPTTILVQDQKLESILLKRKT